MRTDTSETEERIEKRTRHACVESMTVHPHGSGSEMFDVYNADGKRYVVDLRDGVCECPDYEHREPADGCKHQRRVRLEFGIMDVPAAIRDEHAALTDVELARRRRGIDVEPEPVEEHEPITVSDAKPARRVATDGGQLLEAEPQEDGETCDYPGCEHGLGKERPELCFPHWEARQEARR